MNNVKFEYVNGHVEVFYFGVFLFSADTKAEAEAELVSYLTEV